MQTTRQEYRQFLNYNFNRLKLRQPLFYNWEFGLRFDLQVNETGADEYLREVTRRASIIFKTAFEESDNVFLVFMDYQYRRRKIRFENFAFKQISDLKKTEVLYSKEKRLYQPDIDFNVAIVKLSADRINYKNILTAIGHSDFPPRQPRLDNSGFLTSKEVYFINIEKKLIFHMYDDRGLDIVATEKETLMPIYEEHYDLVLGHDRERIDKQFE